MNMMKLFILIYFIISILFNIILSGALIFNVTYILFRASVPTPSTVVPIPSKTHVSVCKDTWLTFNNKCYYFNYDVKTWEDGNKWCLSQNSTLVVLENKDEVEFVYMFVCSYSWIGLKKQNNTFVWVDNTPYNKTVLILNDDTKPYVYVSGSAMFSTITGSAKIAFVCSYKLS